MGTGAGAAGAAVGVDVLAAWFAIPAQDFAGPPAAAIDAHVFGAAGLAGAGGAAETGAAGVDVAPFVAGAGVELLGADAEGADGAGVVAGMDLLAGVGVVSSIGGGGAVVTGSSTAAEGSEGL